MKLGRKLYTQLAVLTVIPVAFALIAGSFVVLNLQENEWKHFENRLNQNIKQRTGVSFKYPMGEQFIQSELENLKKRILTLSALIIVVLCLTLGLALHLLVRRAFSHKLSALVLPTPNKNLNEIEQLIQNQNDLYEQYCAQLELNKATRTRSQLLDRTRLEKRIALSIANKSAELLSPMAKELEAQIEKCKLQNESDIEKQLGSLQKTSKKISEFADSLAQRRLGFDPTPQTFCLIEIARRVRTVVSEQNPDAQIEVLESFPDSMPAAIGQVDEIESMIYHLISNAFEAVNKRGNGRVTIDADYDDTFVSLSIEDNGSGLTLLESNHDLQLFSSSKDPIEHLGIGLGLSQDIIQRHQGKFIVKTDSGRRTQIKVKIPRANRNEFKLAA